MYDLNYFKKYALYKKRLDVCEFELIQDKRNNNVNAIQSVTNEICMIKNKMAQIKLNIEHYATDQGKDELNNMEERLFLRCRYVDGMTMEQTAEMLNVSRNTVYRIKNKIEGQLRKSS